MKEIILPYFYLFFAFINKFSSGQSISFENYFLGNLYNSANEPKKSDVKNSCLCDITLGSCDYLCCCDEDCPSEAVQDWSNHLKCTNEKDTIGIFADRCIDQNLVIFSNNRRGLKIENQTEDIAKTNRVIYNYCYSMDNSKKMKNDIISLNDLKNYGFKEINNALLQEVSQSIAKQEFSSSDTQDQSMTSDVDTNNKKYIKITGTNNNFEKSGFFSLYSGSSCQHSKNVEILKPENYSCFMSNNILGESFIENIKFEGIEDNCEIKHRYLVTNGLISFTGSSTSCSDAYTIKEVEFIIKMSNTQSKMENCYINIVCLDNNNDRIFKNSVIFTNLEDGRIPYRYSGNGGYLNNFPIKIYYDNGEVKGVFNDFFIVGRDLEGKCRRDIDENNYLYNVDKPIYFKQDYSYSCSLDGQGVSGTTLFQKINNIKKIARYGSSSYNNINNNDDWLDVSSTKEIDETNDKHILMNFYIGKKTTGLYSHNYIYNVTIKSDNKYNNGDDLLLEIKFYDLEKDENNENKYDKKPSTPIILPNIPEDLLEPLIYSDVDK